MTEQIKEQKIELLRTPLYEMHVENGAKFIPFAGTEMPVQYTQGIIKEHLHTRMAAGLFDISHMGQICAYGPQALQLLETLMPGEFVNLATGNMRYSFLLRPDGGIIDDLMVTSIPRSWGEQLLPANKSDDQSLNSSVAQTPDYISDQSVQISDQSAYPIPNKLVVSPAGEKLPHEYVFLVVNAANKKADLDLLQKNLPEMHFKALEQRALLALQGPQAARVLSSVCTEVSSLAFMSATFVDMKEFGHCLISRSGYTGEDGFEVSILADKAVQFARHLLQQEGCQLIGLGARDSLRLEAGLCLHGHDITQSTTPIEAKLSWAIGKSRRQNGGFVGDDVVLQQLRNGTNTVRVGILPSGRALARENTPVLDQQGNNIGVITSGGFGPSLHNGKGGPVCMGYVQSAFSSIGTAVLLQVRGQNIPAEICQLPFVAHRYHKA